MSTVDAPTERIRENAVEITSMLMGGLGFLALFSGFSYFWLILVLGFAVVVPIVAMPYGDEGDQKEWWDDWWGGRAEHKQ